MKGLNILLLTSLANPYGTEQYFADLAEELTHRGHKVLAVVPKRGWLGEELDNRGVATARVQLRRNSPISYLTVAKHHFSLRPAVIHAHASRAVRFGSFLSRLYRTPFVASSHISTPGRAFVDAARAGASVVGVSHVVCDALKALGVPESNLNLIYPGTRTALLPPTLRDPAALEELGVPPSRFVCGLIGRIVPGKGQWLAVEALARLPERERAKVHLLFVGGPTQGESSPLRELIGSLGLGGQVTLAGVRHDVPRLLSSMDAVLLPSIAEGMPLSVLEAMCMARPVIVTRVGDLPLLIRDGENGLLIERDPVALALAMLRLLRDPELRARMGACARADGLSQFQPDRMVDQHEALYSSLVQIRSTRLLAES